jgi:hypothetical protein
MAAGACIPLPHPEVGIVERATPDEQTTVVAESLPTRSVVVGGCCCSDVGAANGLALGVGRLAMGNLWECRFD